MSRQQASPSAHSRRQQPDAALAKVVADFVRPRFEAAVNMANKADRDEAIAAVEQDLVTSLEAKYPERSKEVRGFFEKELKAYVRAPDSGEGRAPGRSRPDGYPPNLLRGRLAAAHPRLGALHSRPDAGAEHRDAWLARRGAAHRRSGRRRDQALHPPLQLPVVQRRRDALIAWAGSPRDRARRASRARVAASNPDAREFPYTIRVVSEVLSSNGSTSMGASAAALSR